ncbi:nuclear transport factor 2 family protein [Actinomadura citrea]|uniref:Ketosteroid isomerase-like protein n=1 Tax=Actinomadura citrea TaxID=46158 RepID=A0A7Y9GJD4_9ACTN|nr:nuclear transport factor 2 family protein [Actinomadura citrea]NYE17592.1 ketosteroid isomerase-like protein [Actinomadura citrea]GGU03423.1 polyketide cyclase [Actinomadura citrea]
MPPTNPPTGSADQLRWLVDRAAISDLLIDFARALDDQDWKSYAANFTEDGAVIISPLVAKTITHRGREGLAEFVAGNLGRYAGTHHLSTNHAITLDADTADARSAFVAAHLFDTHDPLRHADGAGWHYWKLRRTPDGWRIAQLTLEVCYLSGEPLLH